jgi:hypothetical protein
MHEELKFGLGNELGWMNILPMVHGTYIIPTLFAKLSSNDVIRFVLVSTNLWAFYHYYQRLTLSLQISQLPPWRDTREVMQINNPSGGGWGTLDS